MTLRRIVPIALLTALALGAAARPVHSAPADTLGLPYVTSIRTEPAQPCAGVPTRIVLTGTFPTSCGAVLKADSDSLVIRLATPSPICGVCLPESSRTWTATLDLGLLAAGSFTVRFRFDVVDSCYTPDPKVDQYAGRLNIDVARTCPQENPIRFVDFVHVTSGDPQHALICPGDSILVTVGGMIDNCHVLRRVDVLWPAFVDPIIPVPVVRLVFDNQCCAVPLCDPLLHPWEAAVALLPPLPTGNYEQIVEAVEVCCRDTVLPGDPSGQRTALFSVTTPESCGVGPLACLLPSWDHSGRVGMCDTELGPDRRASLTFLVRSNTALAALQGDIEVGPSPGAPHLQIVSVEPTGPAAGMQLTWRPTLTGASFVMFAEAGAPIPPADSAGAPPVLRLTFAQTGTDSGPPPPDSGATAARWYVSANDLLGSDVNGHGVPMCPVRLLVIPAVICAASGQCDLNGDAHADVRDLVLMVHCLNGTGPCPADPVTSLDCDGDHDFDLDDVLCCARRVLVSPDCPGCWGDSSRTEPAIAVQFGTPVRSGDGFDIPVRIDGADRMGAARLTFGMPDALASRATITMDPTAAGWLEVDQARTGTRVIGLMDLQPLTFAPRPSTLAFTLHVPAPAAGSAEITVGAAQFSGGDGVRLVADLGSPAVRLGAGVSLSLGAAKPNPFGAATEFSLSLDAAADVDLGIYDLAGRRVAQLHHGRLDVGVHRFTWNGRADEGGRARAGVYFARATGAGASTVRKLILVQGQ
jgi:hypothetical protein